MDTYKFFFVSKCASGYAWTGALHIQVPTEPEDSSGPLEVEVTGGCELCDMVLGTKRVV